MTFILFVLRVVSLSKFCFVFITKYKIMSERVESLEDICVMLVDLCQVDSSFAGPPLLPVFMPDVTSGLDVIGSSSRVSSLAVSSLPVSDGVVVISGGEVVSVSVGESYVDQVSNIVGSGVGVSTASGAVVGRPGLSVASVTGESGRLVSVGGLDERSAMGVCGKDGLGSQVCQPHPFKCGVDGDHGPISMDFTDLSIRGGKSRSWGEVEGALVSGSSMVMCVEGVCPSKFTGS